jgi:hypothetical protein
MNPVVEKALNEKFDCGSKDFKRLMLPGADFHGRDLKHADFRGASVISANFRDCDLKFANFEGANLYGSDFTGANLHRANLKDANTSCTVMHVKDLYGVTITLECKSFQGMKLYPGWWFGWIFYALLMEAPSEEWEAKLITFLGPERYSVLRSQYARRQL